MISKNEKIMYRIYTGADNQKTPYYMAKNEKLVMESYNLDDINKKYEELKVELNYKALQEFKPVRYYCNIIQFPINNWATTLKNDSFYSRSWEDSKS